MFAYAFFYELNTDEDHTSKLVCYQNLEIKTYKPPI